MTNHDTTGQRVTTFHTLEIQHIFGALGSLQQAIAQAQWGWPDEARDAVTKALNLITLSPTDTTGQTRISIGPFQIIGDPAPLQNTDQNGGN